jgi:TolB protein
MKIHFSSYRSNPVGSATVPVAPSRRLADWSGKSKQSTIWPKYGITLSILIFIFCACSLSAREDAPIKIVKPATQLINVALTGFSGEAGSILAFDLSVLGMEITTPDKADYVVSGRANGKVEGSLTAAGTDHPLWLRSYSGGSTRSQAHALANDIARDIRQTPPIFLGKIAFRLQDGSATEICVSDFDGFNSTPVTRDGSLVSGPAWIPGGGGLFYTSWKSGDTQILKHNLATGARSVFAGYPGANFSAEVSPDGQKVAMILSKGGSPNLYVSDIDGGNPRKLTNTRDEDSSPCWNPGSSEICFVCRTGRAQLQIVSAEGGQARPLRVAGVFGNLTSPDWSPDGKQIAFTSGSGNFKICVAPAEGGEAQRLVDGEDPCWAPNSRTIIFCRRSNNKRTLCLLDVPTKHVKDVRQLSGNCSEPSWAR